RENLRAFVERAAEHPRYRLLPRLEEGYRITGSNGDRHDVPRNAIFNQRVAELNFQRVARLVQQTPEYAFRKFEIAATLRCAGFPSWTELFDHRGIPTQSWYMNIDPSDRLIFETPGYSRKELLAALVESDPELQPFF